MDTSRTKVVINLVDKIMERAENSIKDKDGKPILDDNFPLRITFDLFETQIGLYEQEIIECKYLIEIAGKKLDENLDSGFLEDYTRGAKAAYNGRIFGYKAKIEAFQKAKSELLKHLV